MYRTHTCGELSQENVGEKVVLSGWVNKQRDMGHLIFIDLRDFYGLTQLIVELGNSAFEVARMCRSEYVVKVEGEVKERNPNTINKDLPTGKIEVRIEKIEILNKSETPPFEISNEKIEINEELRSKYRYLDLRRKKIQDNLVFKDQMIQFIHRYMHGLGYMEINTPLLTASTPEGSRDFLVPSRKHPGKFYALPQAPQQYKQLLMVGGIDKYYQIAPCLRDEDPRADRLAGVFYQLDVECSFMTAEEFFQEQEPLWIKITEEFAGKKVSQKPFPRIPYKEAMDRYGSDKPDLRYGLEFYDFSEMCGKCNFSIFNESKVIKGICIPSGGQKISRNEIEGNLTKGAKQKGAAGMVALKVGKEKLEGRVAKFFNEGEKSAILKKFGASEGDLLLFIAGEYSQVVEPLGWVRQEVAEMMDLVDPNLVAWAWIVDFPMFEKNVEGKIDFMHNPFSMPKGGMKDLSEKDPLDIIADQYDIVANGYELCSGAVRNNRPDILYKAFEIAGYKKEEIDRKFGHMIQAFKYGAPPHCGYAPGIDRIMMVLLGETNIREMVAFPKNSQAVDLMMNAPSEIEESQLKELGIKLDL